MTTNSKYPSPEQLPQTSRSLPISLIRARESVMSPVRTMLLDTGLTEQQWRILRVLNEAGPIDATSLSDKAGLLAPSTTRILSTMIKKQYVSRSPHPVDGRRHVIALLPKGLEIVESKHDEAIEVSKGYREKLGAEDYEHLLDLLDRLINP